MTFCCAEGAGAEVCFDVDGDVIFASVRRFALLSAGALASLPLRPAETCGEVIAAVVCDDVLCCCRGGC